MEGHMSNFLNIKLASKDPVVQAAQSSQLARDEEILHCSPVPGDFPVPQWRMFHSHNWEHICARNCYENLTAKIEEDSKG